MSRVNRIGGTIIEIMVVILILTTDIIGVYSILGSSTRLASTTEKRIQAINLAREGLEIVQNIRDTNWIRYSSNYEGCWSTLNYDTNCISGGGMSMSGTYLPILTASGWTLSNSMTESGIYLDQSGLSIQGIAKPTQICNTFTQKSCFTPFSRILTITPVGTGTLSVRSSVTWGDAASTKKHTIDLDLTLKNWKMNGY